MHPLLEAPGRTQTCSHLDLDFWPPDPQDNMLLLLKLPSCSTLLWWPQETHTAGSDSHETLGAGFPLTHTTSRNRAELGCKRMSQTRAAYSLLRLSHRLKP